MLLFSSIFKNTCSFNTPLYSSFFRANIFTLSKIKVTYPHSYPHDQNIKMIYYVRSTEAGLTKLTTYQQRLETMNIGIKDQIQLLNKETDPVLLIPSNSENLDKTLIDLGKEIDSEFSPSPSLSR